MNGKGVNLNRAGSKVILWFLILAMLGFTVTRTLHFLQQTFPPDQQYVAYLALAAFDVGVLGWLYYATQAAEGTGQRVVGYGMIFVCAAGVIITTIADMLMVSAKNGVTNKLPPDVATAALWAVMIVIALNFFAGVLVHLLDPKHLKHMAVEGAKDRIHASVHEAIGQRANEIAPRIADRIAAYWEAQITEEMTGHMPPSAKAPAPTKVTQLPAASQSSASAPSTKVTQLPAMSYRPTVSPQLPAAPVQPVQPVTPVQPAQPVQPVTPEVTTGDLSELFAQMDNQLPEAGEDFSDLLVPVPEGSPSEASDEKGGIKFTARDSS